MLSLMLGAVAALNIAPMRSAAVARAAAPQMAVGLVYSTTTGNTETVAGYIAAATGLEAVDIGDAEDADFCAHDTIICGAPTWHTGADTERSGTVWDEFLYDRLPSLDL